ncbi:MAG: hypothetical protein ABJE66_12415 [Deltaproteobacteria bacterium]
MGATRFVVLVGVLAGCLPQTADPQYPQQQQQPPPYQQQQQQPPQPAPQGGVAVGPTDPAQPPQPAPQGGVSVGATVQVGPAQPQPQPQPYPAPQGNPPTPYGQQPPPYSPAPYVAYVPNAQPQDNSGPSVIGRSHFYDGEVITDFATVGVLAAADLAVRQDVTNGNAITFLILGGVAGGGGAGYLLTQKYSINAGAAHATTIGLMLGLANGALLIQPADYHDAASIMGLLTVGSLAGAAGGFIYGQNADLTDGQSLFVGNLMLLGSSTAALTAVTANRDGAYGSFENTTLALGLDGGAVVGALVAPHLDWSPRRAKIVFASTFVGALAGGLLAGMIAKPRNGDTTDTNASVVTGAMTAGLWGGFGLGILITRDQPVDPKYLHATKSGTSGTATQTSFAPWIGANGQLGVMSGGTF